MEGITKTTSAITPQPVKKTTKMKMKYQYKTSTPLNIEPPTAEEVIEAILQLKNNKKQLEVMEFSPELLKASPSTLAELIQPLIEEIWITKNNHRR